MATTLRPDPTIKLPELVTHNKCLTLNIPTQTPAVRRWLPCTAGDFVAVGTVLNLLIVTEEDGARHGCRNRTGVSVACHEPYVADALTEQQQQQPLPDHTVCDTGVAVVRADMRTGVTGSLFSSKFLPAEPATTSAISWHVRESFGGRWLCVLCVSVRVVLDGVCADGRVGFGRPQLTV